MTYFDCFLIVAWTFAIGWAVGAIYMQSHSLRDKKPRAVAKPDQCPDCHALRLPSVNNAVIVD